VLLAAVPAAAQYDAPGVFITLPAAGATGWQTVLITWTHDHALDGFSRQVWWNGEPVADVDYTAEMQSDDGSHLLARSDVQLWFGAGNQTVQARICAVDGPCTTASASTEVPAPPSVPRADPVISLAPHHSGFQDPARYGSTLSYTTPAYVSLDQPRTLTLLYVSETAFPRSFVQVDVTDLSTDRPDAFSITIADSTGATRAQSNGGHIACWRNTGDTAQRVTRLAAQWTMLSVASSAPRSTVIVRSYWEEPNGTTTMRESRDSIRVPMVNRASSPYGAGWMVAGVQRLHPSASGVLVDEGTGAASWFRQGGIGGLVAPTGDRSTLVYESGTASYRRTWLDGSGIVFTALGYPVYRYNVLGDTTRYTFSGDRLTSVTDPAGKSFQLFYDGANKLQRIVDPQGRTVQVTIAGNLLTQIVDYDSVPALSSVTYEVNSAGAVTRRVSGWTDRAGGQWNVQYDIFGTPVAITAPQVTLANGQAARPRTTGTSEKTRVLTGSGNYPASGRPRALPTHAYSAFTDARGHTTIVSTDRFGQPLQVTGPLGHGTTIQRDTLGNPLSVTTPGGRRAWPGRPRASWPAASTSAAVSRATTATRPGAAAPF
jgi:YD repeat-containing protein